MPIKVLSVNDVAVRKVRSIEEVEEMLKKIVDQVKDDDALMQRFSKLFASMETAAGSVTIRRSGKSSGVGGTQIDPIFITNLNKLKTSFDVVESLQAKLDILDNLQLQVDHLLKGEGSRVAIGKNISTARKLIEKKLDTAYNFLNTVGKKHEPEIFQTQTDEIISDITTRLYEEKVLGDHDVYVYLTTKDDDAGLTTLYFSKYLALFDLKDDTGFVYDEYYIVFTGIVSPNAELNTYCTTLSKWIVPTKFKPGHEFTNVKNGIAAVEGMLDLENFTHLVSGVPSPLSRGEINLDAKLVQNVTVKGDIIHVALKPTKQLDAVVETVTKQLMAILSAKSDVRVKKRLERQSTNYVIHYRLLVPEDKEHRHKYVTTDKLALLKDRLGFDDDDIAKIVRLLNN